MTGAVVLAQVGYGPDGRGIGIDSQQEKGFSFLDAPLLALRLRQSLASREEMRLFLRSSVAGS